MRFYEKYFKNNYEQLITYYPRFYRDVYEMVEILKAQGGIADELEGDIEQAYLNCFIDYADEDTIGKLEKFLMIGLNKSRTLEERRRLVKSFFVGFGKVSSTMLAEMIQSNTGADVYCKFEPFDDEGNNRLYLYFQRGDEPTLYMSDINLLLGKKIPAHIDWQALLTYNFPTGIGIRRTHYKHDYDLTGTKPDIAMLGAIVGVAAVTQARANASRVTHGQTAEADVLTGTSPDVATIGSLVAVNSVLETGVETYTTNFKASSEDKQEAGQWPSVAELGATTKINAAAGVKATDYGVDYIYCGTTQSQS